MTLVPRHKCFPVALFLCLILLPVSDVRAQNPCEQCESSVTYESGNFFLTVSGIQVGDACYWMKWRLDPASLG